MSTIVRILPVAQNYAWGKIGSGSAVAQLLVAGGSIVDPSKPYAELWMSSHPSGPARLASDPSITLAQHLAANTAQNFGSMLSRWPHPNSLPFLLKVLSIEKALSIQAHPDLERAKRLHTAAPNLYPDANHKPELACAISPFEALCEFRPVEEICAFLDSVPELRAAVGNDEAAKFQQTVRRSASKEASTAALRSLYSALMHREPAQLTARVNELNSRLRSSAHPTPLEIVILRIYDQFPGDLGVLHIYLLNYVQLQVGEALFLAANEPHAYVSGECVEIMASSDNVVRAGLTPKPKDVNTLVEMLTYRSGFPKVLSAQPVDSVRSVYSPPVEEFQLDRFIVSSSYSMVCSLPSIFLVLEGTGTMKDHNRADSAELKRGFAFFVSANTRLEIASSGGGPLVLYRATCNENICKL